eukprot:TRINITY_DN13658_c1_g6_i1.p1 TRINITY_DN13658_c1_g6~~TRINITY_DN13658_c1_g6_i1.p1  ORF type:complete len:121 (-),score=21.85 TRINITY_DN13658_c1_g6_i1:20-382(-)
MEVCTTTSAVNQESASGVDEYLSEFLLIQQLQEKEQEVMRLMESHPVTNANSDFRRGLEDLIKDHMRSCMAFATCSAPPHDPSTPSTSSVGTGRVGSSSWIPDIFGHDSDGEGECSHVCD